MNAKTIIVGIGSPNGDDQVGWQIADRLSEAELASALIYKASSPSKLLDYVEKTGELVICDACRADGAIGTVWRWNWPTDAIQSDNFCGSHDLSLPAALELANHLGLLPGRVTIWGVNIGGAETAGNASPEISAAASAVAQRIIDSLNYA